ncbi:MAG: thiol-activated cytolysin family protein [Treponema sp.]|uniref:hypothetical protein n=1 Tax=Treponema sp. TaxID=166 RepID=UPI00298ECAC7|nr:hypothetical protein [Treponema sp.]MBR5934110.1 thiol-activated cytolysin family protein [Treponema sp.]
MRKNNLLKIGCVLILTALIFSSCATTGRAKQLISRGDRVSAVEVLARRLSSKSDDAEAVDLFIGIYPAVVEDLSANGSVSQIRKEFAAKYNTSEAEAVKKCRDQVGKAQKVLSHPDISSVTSRSSKIISNYADLIRIQRAVATMPSVIGSPKTGEYEVRKYNDDYNSLYATARFELGQFYYIIGDAFYPGTEIEERTWLIDVYKKADSYSGGSGQSASKCAELSYLNGYDYESVNSIEGHKAAISWYKNSASWISGYRDTAKRIQMLSYEIAMALAQVAQTKNDYKEIIGYLTDAGNYKDAASQIIVMKYYLAYLYRDEHTVKSYEEAGKLFAELGNYKRAPYETSLYEFYKKLKSLTKDHSDGKISLTSGRYSPFTMTRNMSSVENGTAVLSLSGSTSNIDVYIPSMEKIIYPASMINGDTITTQRFTAFNYGSRNPVEFSISSSGTVLGNGVVTYPYDGTYSVNEVRKAAAKYTSSINPDYTYEFHTIHSPEDLALTTGIGAGRDKVAYSVSFNNWDPDKSYTLVKVTQKFYSAAIAPPALPVDFFAVDKNVISPSTLKTVTPYYVSSVDYGRKAYFVISSDLPSEEIVKDFIACRPRDSKNSGATGMRVNSDISYKWSHNSTYVSAITVSEKIYSINDLDSMYNWIKIGTSMAVEVDEIVPISFTLRNLADNSYARLSQSKKVKVRIAEPKEVNETKTESSASSTIPTPKETPKVPEYDGDYKPSQPASGGSSSGSTVKPSSGSGTSSGSTATQPAEQTKPASAYETASTINGVKVPASAYNGTSSLIFVGKKAYYTCSTVTTERGSGVKTMYYDIPADEIEVCVASWSDSEYKTVQVNGINMTKNKTVYSFRDVHGNTISLDTVDSNGIRVHNLLVVRKK